MQTPERKAAQRAYAQKPKSKAAKNAREQTPEYKAVAKAYKQTPQRRLAVNLRTRMWKAVKRNQRAGSVVRDLGCTINELKAHLESKFQQGMTWGNWAFDGWHIDHIKPLASFDLTDREQFKEACHYTNLQPLWAEENLSKGAK